MEKYRRVRPAREPLGSDEIRVTTMGRVEGYVSYASTLIEDQKKSQITIKASGNAIGQAIALAEQLKRRFRGLHQLNTCGNTTVSLVYEPLEEGLDTLTQERVVAFLEIKLSFNPLDSTKPGYQPPLDDELIEEFKQIAGSGVSGRGRGGFRGRNRGGPPRGLGGEGGEGEETSHADLDMGDSQQQQQQQQETNTGFKGRGRGRGGFRGGYRGGFRGAPRGAARGGRGE